MRRFVAGLTKSVPKFDLLNLSAELILCLYEAQCSADCASLFGGKCSLQGERSLDDGDICEPLQGYALGYCISNSKASWKNIDLSGGITLDSLVWGARSIKSCGGGIGDMEIYDYEGDQLATNYFMNAPLTGLSSLTCFGTSDILDKISHANPVMTRLEELHIPNIPDNFRVSNLLIQLVSSNVKTLTLSLLTNESVQECCSALQQLVEPSSSGKFVELKLDISPINASKLLNIILAPSSLQAVTLYAVDKVTFLDLPANCTNSNVVKLTCDELLKELFPAQVVVDLMERNRALQELIIIGHEVIDHHLFLLYSYDVIKGIPESSSLERILVLRMAGYGELKIGCREEVDYLRECANKQSADSFIKLVTEQSLIKPSNIYFLRLEYICWPVCRW